MRSFAKIKASRNGESSLSFTDEGKSCQTRKFLTSLICLLTLFAKIKFSRKFPNLQYFRGTKDGMTEEQKYGMPNTMSPRFSSKWRRTKILTVLMKWCLMSPYPHLGHWFILSTCLQQFNVVEPLKPHICMPCRNCISKMPK